MISAVTCSVCGDTGHDVEGCASPGYIREVQAALKSHCLPIWFTNELGRRVHGSMTVVQTTEAILGVTAKHVADRIIECCTPQSGVRCQIGSALLPTDSFISRHPDLDLASFRLSPSIVMASGRKAASVVRWPPFPPSLGDMVMLGGYPGEYRVAFGGKYYSDFASFGGRITDIGSRNFSVEIPLENSISVSRKVMPPHVDLGGVSGGGVFRLIETTLPDRILWRLELTGIIYFGSPGFEVLNAHPLTSLKPNGEFS